MVHYSYNYGHDLTEILLKDISKDVFIIVEPGSSSEF